MSKKSLSGTLVSFFMFVFFVQHPSAAWKDDVINELEAPGSDVGLVFRTETQKLTALDAASHAAFGTSMDVDGDYAVIGAPFDDNAGDDAGAAYIFHGVGSDWHQQAKFTAMDASAGDEFGYSVDLHGNFTVVSAMMDNENGTDSGSAYLFNHDGTTWLQLEKFTASDAAANDYFGMCVGINGNYAFAGSSFKDHSGAVYAYDFSSIPTFTP